MLGISIPVGDGMACHSTLYRSPSYSRRDFDDEAMVDGLRDEVLRAKGKFLSSICLTYVVGDGSLGQCCYGTSGGKLHLSIDRCGMSVECSTENIGEGKDIVDLIGVIRSPCTHKNFGTSGLCFLVRYLWSGIS